MTNLVPKIITPDQHRGRGAELLTGKALDDALVERFERAIKGTRIGATVFVDLQGLAPEWTFGRNVDPDKLDPVRKRCEEIATTNHWRLEWDGRSGYPMLEYPDVPR